MPDGTSTSKLRAGALHALPTCWFGCGMCGRGFPLGAELPTSEHPMGYGVPRLSSWPPFAQSLGSVPGKARQAASTLINHEPTRHGLAFRGCVAHMQPRRAVSMRVGSTEPPPPVSRGIVVGVYLQ